MTFQHKALLGYVAQEAHSLDFDSCTEEQQADVRKDTEELYLSYVILIQSRTQHINFNVDIKNNFNTVNNIYPKSFPQTIHLLCKYSKIVVPKIPDSK